MTYNEKVADRIREILAAQKLKKVTEKNMFGGVAFMVNDKMCVGVIGDDMMARIDPEIYELALEKKGIRAMDFTGKPMKGYIYVDKDGMAKKAQLEFWVGLALDFNMIAKAAKKKAPAKKAPAKKVAKKKASAKKVTTKKVATKKASAKKVTTKKVATKKAPAKKVAKKKA
jgi:TfoX/Sxy family transcriptional regulator of competence genes